MHVTHAHGGAGVPGGCIYPFILHYPPVQSFHSFLSFVLEFACICTRLGTYLYSYLHVFVLVLALVWTLFWQRARQPEAEAFRV